MAIGVEGGFDVDEDAGFDIVKEHFLVLTPLNLEPLTQ
jgi:hypothetical protein